MKIQRIHEIQRTNQRTLQSVTRKRLEQQRKAKPYDTARYDAYLIMLAPLITVTIQQFDCIPLDFPSFCRKLFDRMGPLATKIFQNISPRKFNILYFLQGLFSFHQQQRHTRELQGYLRSRVFQNIQPMSQKQITQMTLPDEIKRKIDIKKSINAASISEVFQYSTQKDKSQGQTNYIIKVVRPSSKTRFIKEKVVIENLLPTIQDKSVVRFIKALIEDVEQEMNLTIEAKNMEKARNDLERFLKQRTKAIIPFQIPTVQGSAENYIIMDRVEGKTLAQILKNPVVTGEHLACLIRLMETYVQYIQGFHNYTLHADLHPGNIMFSSIRPSLSMTLIDWGRVVRVSDTEYQSARVLLDFYNLREDNLQREDELLLVCRMQAEPNNYMLYFFWLDKFFIPSLPDFKLTFLFTNIYAWILELEAALSEMIKTKATMIQGREEDFFGNKSIFSDKYCTHDFTWTPLVYGYVDTTFVNLIDYMYTIVLIIRRCFQLDPLPQRPTLPTNQAQLSNFVDSMKKWVQEKSNYDETRENKIKAFFKKTSTDSFKQEFQEFLARNATNVIDTALEKSKDESFPYQFYNSVVFKLYDSHLYSNTSLRDMLYTSHSASASLGGTLGRRGMTERFGLREAKKWAQTFKVQNLQDLKNPEFKLPFPKDTEQKWKHIFQGLQTARDDNRILPLSDTSTFMRVFDAIGRLWKTVEMTSDKVKIFQGSRPTTIHSFLTQLKKKTDRQWEKRQASSLPRS